MSPPSSSSAAVVRGVSVKASLGSGPLLLRSFRYRERLGVPFEGVVEVVADDADLDLGEPLGKPVTVSVPLPGGGTRYFSGLCLEAEQTGVAGDVSAYRLVIVAWIRLLELASDCRIFQDKTPTQILEKVFGDLGFSDYQTSGIVGNPPPLPFCVQYEETHHDFVHRLAQRFGIAYYSTHADGKHTLHFHDSSSSLKPFPGYDKILYWTSEAAAASAEHVFEWRGRRRLETGKVSLKDYTYTDPKATLEAQSTASHSYPHGDLERFAYPGLFAKKADGEALARIRLGEHACRENVFTGEARCYGLAPGTTFRLEGHPRKDQNAGYLTTAIDLTIEPCDDPTAGRRRADAFACTCAFEAIPDDVDFRPPPTARVPRIAGHQTAVVVGPAGHDPKTPYTDDYGNIRVQFRWDRQGKNNEQSSCWIRYQQFAAGPGWGAVFLPRIGCEVTVVFEGGDPDRPLAIGSLYNNDNKPPTSLPGEARTFAIQDDGGNYLTLSPDEGNQVVTFHSPTDNTTLKVGKT